jgi:hypothetical protein
MICIKTANAALDSLAAMALRSAPFSQRKAG